MELIEVLLKWGGPTLIGLILGIWLITQFPQVKLAVSAVLGLFGGAGKWFRRKTLETEIEGTMNSFSRSFNREYTFELLPECNVQWVSAANQAKVLRAGKAIIKLSFSKDDHDLNFYNAAQAYVETGLLPDTRPFLVRATATAIDLLMVRMLLTKGRRNALRIFNAKFVDQDTDAKAVYLKLEETDKESLFRQLLLPELHLFGQSVAQQTPSDEIYSETERFINWFYELATRPAGELTKLSFESENIKVGIILVADLETFERKGIRAYLNRANLYAARDYQCVYILARGQQRADLAANIGRQLCNTGGYSQINKRTVVTMHKEGTSYLVTCIALKPDITAIVRNAWERLQEDCKASRFVLGTVDHATEDTVRVDVYGLKFDLTREQLSSVEIGPAYRFFERDQELELRILKCSAAEQMVELSNCDTKTDPKNIIALVEQSAGQHTEARVENILSSRDVEIGWTLLTNLGDRTVRAFLPRKNGTFSRFISLKEKFPVGSGVRVITDKFDFVHGRLNCRLEDLRNPWDPLPSLKTGVNVTVVIREITENHATCEIQEGLEARLFHQELSWDTPENNRRKMQELKVSERIDAVVSRFDSERRQISVSIKRLTKSETQRFFDDFKQTPVDARVDKVGKFGATVTFRGKAAAGNLNIRDIIWGYCERVSDHLRPGEVIKVKLLSYDPWPDSINVGIKQLESNDFELFQQQHGVKSVVKCEVMASGQHFIRVRARFQSTQVFGYFHLSQASSVIPFIDEAAAKHMFRVGDIYHCTVHRFDPQNSLVEFSRKEYLAFQVDKLEYGESFPSRVVFAKGDIYAYGDVIEGKVVSGYDTSRKQRTDVEVMLSRKGRSPRDIELTVV